MINTLKSVLLPYVREPSDLEIWIDEGRSESYGKTLYLDQVIVINVSEMVKDWRSIIACVQHWYDQQNLGKRHEGHDEGLTFDVIPFREDDVGMQIRLALREKVIYTMDDEGMIDAKAC